MQPQNYRIVRFRKPRAEIVPPRCSAARWSLWLLLLPLLAFQVQASCFDAKWKRGRPYDYYAGETRVSTGTYRGGLLYLVESVHFTQKVQMLEKGSTSSMPGDLGFVLNTIPNHPSALDAYSRYEKRYQESKQFRDSKRTRRPGYKVSCLFERAVRTFPQHAETFVVWGVHSYRNNRLDEAGEAFKKALSLEPDNVVAHYNLGLVYVDGGKFDMARQHAEVAYAGGYPLEGLRKRLQEAEEK